MQNEKIMIPLREAAEITGISYEELRRLCLCGCVPHIRVRSRNGKFLLNYEGLIHYLSTAGMAEEVTA